MLLSSILPDPSNDLLESISRIPTSMISSPAPQIISLNTESLIDFDDLASLSRLAARRKLQVAAPLALPHPR